MVNELRASTYYQCNLGPPEPQNLGLGSLRNPLENAPTELKYSKFSPAALQNPLEIVYTEVKNQKNLRLRRALCAAGDVLLSAL